ncbi:hypothetical protein HWE06_17895 [Pantoea dispersa]|nr:hypothetical protein [Pantoea dispersa]
MKDEALQGGEATAGVRRSEDAVKKRSAATSALTGKNISTRQSLKKVQFLHFYSSKMSIISDKENAHDGMAAETLAQGADVEP